MSGLRNLPHSVGGVLHGVGAEANRRRLKEDSVAPEPIAIPQEVRALLDAPNYVHLSTLRVDGSPRNHVGSDASVGRGISN